MTGYQEILTDPSYHGQIVTMTYPMIGNYGVNAEDAESRRPWVRGFVVRELSRPRQQPPRGRDARRTISPEHGVIGIEGIDTRALVRLTRAAGALEGDRLDDRPRRRPPGRQGEGKPRPDRPRPGPRSHARGRRPGSRGSRPGSRWRGGHHRTRPSLGEPPASRRGARLRDEVEHPPPPGRDRLPGDGRARHDAGRRRSWNTSPTASSSPMDRATRPRWSRRPRRSGP